MGRWYTERIPVGFAVHCISVFLIVTVPLPFWLSIIATVWHEVGNLVHHGKEKGHALGKRAGMIAATAGALLGAFDMYLELTHPQFLWRNACGRGIVVFVCGVLAGAAWKDIFSIEYLLLTTTASTQLFMTGPLPDFIGHVSIICASDAFQYFVGKSFGRHKAIPSVSPNKTFEGYVGGVFLCNILSFLFAKDISDGAYWAWFNGALLSGIIGDLAISSWKRYHVVKDTSDVLASHGGFLDRVDSHLAAFLFTMAFTNYLGNDVSDSYTKTVAFRVYTCTAVVWAFVWVRFFVQRYKNAPASRPQRNAKKAN